MLYNTGTIAINGNTATGTGTNWTAAASQVRAGQTIIVMSNPVQMFQISSVNSATSMTVTPAASPALSGQKYGILVSDNISVDGLAQAMSQLIKEYDENIGAWETFATTTANQNITVTINGTSVTIPGIGKLAQKGSNGALAIADGGTGATNAADARTNLGLADAIHGVSCDAAGFSGSDTAQPYFRHVDGSLVPLATHSYTQTGLDGRQPKDATLTNLSGKDVAGLLQYLGLTKAVVVENQGSNANGRWRKYTDGSFEAEGFIGANPETGIAIVPLPVQFPAAPTSILVTQYIQDTSSRPGLTTVINSLSGATGFQTMSVDLTGAPYALGFAWRATYAPF